MTKIRTNILLIFSLLCLSQLEAQHIASYFVSIPQELLPQLSINRRKDLIDFAHAKQQSNVQSALGGDATLTYLSDKLLTLSLSPLSQMEVALLSVDSVPMIAVIETVCASACESRISFYDTSWNKLAAKKFIEPLHAKDFCRIGSENFNIEMIALSFEKEGEMITAKLATEEILPQEIVTELVNKNGILPTLQFQWNGKKYLLNGQK